MIVKLLICSSLLLCTTINVNSQDFAFPEVAEEDPSKRNSKNKVPVYLPNKCAENELLYPGDQTDDWVCDCFPAYVYEPMSATCHPVHTQGPCQSGQILVLPKNTSIPVCVQNRCRTKNFVEYQPKTGQKRCVRLKDPEPCRNFRSPMPYLIGVNETTLEVACVPENRGNKIVQESLGTRFNLENELEIVKVTTTELEAAVLVPFARPCAKGSHKVQIEQC